MSGATGVIAGAAVAGAGASIYGATRKVDTPEPRNLAQEARDTLATQIALAPEQYANYATLAPQYAATDLGILRQSLFGAQTFNAAGALASMSPEQRADVAAEAARNGLSAEQWLTGHVAAQAGSDPYARALQQQFTQAAGGGLIDINRQLTDYANEQTIASNTALREADLFDVARLGGQVQAAQRGANTELFGNLDRLDAAAAGPIGAGQYETAAGQLALRGTSPLTLGTFDPSGSLARTSFNAQQVNDAFDFFKVSGPRQDALLAQLNERAMAAAPSSLQTTLEQQAQAELAKGGTLSDDEMRDVRVQTRSAADARGLGYSGAALAAESMNTDAAQRARLKEAQAFAASTDAAGFGQRQQIAQQGLGVVGANRSFDALGQNAQIANQSAGLQTQGMRLDAQRANQSAGLQADALGLQGQLANQGFQLGAFSANSQNQLASAGFNRDSANQQFSQLGALNSMEAARRGESYSRLLGSTQARLGTFVDPFAGVLGRSSANVGTNTNLFSGAQSAVQPGMNTSRGMFDPFNPYASDVYDSNFNSQAAANIASANNSAALTGSLIGAAGTLGGAWIGAKGGGTACWLAREVYGTADGRWREFRRWMFTLAPAATVAWYLANGRQRAARVRRRPEVKPALRAWMDARVSEMNSLELQPLALN